MKTKFIFERLDFERGGNPLEKMRIGRVHSIKRLTAIYTELVNKIDMQKWASGKNWDLRDTLIPEFLKSIPYRYRNTNGWANMDQFFDQLSYEEYYTIDKLITKYYKLLK